MALLASLLGRDGVMSMLGPVGRDSLRALARAFCQIWRLRQKRTSGLASVQTGRSKVSSRVHRSPAPHPCICCAPSRLACVRQSGTAPRILALDLPKRGRCLSQELSSPASTRPCTLCGGADHAAELCKAGVSASARAALLSPGFRRLQCQTTLRYSTQRFPFRRLIGALIGVHPSEEA